MIRSQEENSDCHSCITLWHPHACAYAQLLRKKKSSEKKIQCPA
ncbi:hypothetical protein NP493_1234g00000 [Ridgeia piscesae]|uniref:Uncharacterized protein n=1 Tax=Ridgeia piscesae TaxID=27915 RepID=A0AAD9NFP6_RIDPI|nr:hypothetical protein NP493_1234g00000 [Ridgeia piscesae]